MSTTRVHAFAELKKAQDQAANYSAGGYEVMIIGPTDKVEMLRELTNGIIWSSGDKAELYVMIATKDPIVGPDKGKATGG